MTGVCSIPRAAVVSLTLVCAPAAASALSCDFDTTCEIGGPCVANAGVNVEIIDNDEGEFIVFPALRPIPLTRVHLRETVIFHYQSAPRSYELLSIDADGRAQLFVVYGDLDGDFTYQGTCTGDLS